MLEINRWNIFQYYKRNLEAHDQHHSKWRKTKIFSKFSEQGKNIQPPHLFNIVIGNIHKAKKKQRDRDEDKENIGKEDVKAFLFAEDMISYIKDS